MSLFDDFRLSLANIILDRYNLSIGRFYYYNFDYIACNAIFYTDDIQHNEKIDKLPLPQLIKEDLNFNFLR